jgi:hypothetical protein
MLAKRMLPSVRASLSGVDAGQLHPRTGVLPDPIAAASDGAGWSVHISVAPFIRSKLP